MNNVNQIAIKVKCPNCGKSLMDSDHKLDNVPSIRLIIKYNQQSGMIWLSSVYGSFAVDCDIPLIENEIFNFSCPFCKTDLMSKKQCASCNAPTNSVLLDTGGIINFCSRKGCTKHSVEFEDISLALKQFYDNFDQYSGNNTSEI